MIIIIYNAIFTVIDILGGIVMDNKLNNALLSLAYKHYQLDNSARAIAERFNLSLGEVDDKMDEIYSRMIKTE